MAESKSTLLPVPTDPPTPPPLQSRVDPPAANDEEESADAPPPVATPYSWDEAEVVPTEILQLWTEVGHGIDKHQTVVWKSAVDSLTFANRHLSTSSAARHFCEKSVGQVIGILAEQSPSKIGPHERSCVQESLAMACSIVAADLSIQLARRGECRLLEKVLSHVFNKRKNFYKGQKAVWQQNTNATNGFPEVRLRNIEKFRSASAFRLLHTYLMERVQNEHAVEGLFPGLETMHHILTALLDSMIGTAAIGTTANTSVDSPSVRAATAISVAQEVDAIQISQAVMLHLGALSDDAIKKIPTELLSMTLKALQRIFDRLVTTRRNDCVEFYSFWRRLALTMISSPSLPVKLIGWEQVNEMIKAVTDHRPPPRSFLCSGAGATICNGEYLYAGAVTPDGYAQPNAEVSYVRVATTSVTPPGSPSQSSNGDGLVSNGGLGGHVVTPVNKKLTLFRCTMRSQQKWWFLSEADEEQPGTDRDIDYYQHKSKEHEEGYPPPGGWLTCRNAGVSPSPTLTPVGVMVPKGEELNTLEHQLAQWAIENEIVEKVLGDTTIHREVVSRSTELIKFLASMCTRDPDEPAALPTEPSKSSSPTDDMSTGDTAKNTRPNKYCLQTSHLLFAWKTCTRKADAAVSLQVYQLLVSILPLCPSSLANPLLQAIQRSLLESSEKRDYLYEVSEFCSALAALNLVDVSSSNKAAAVPGTALTEDVRAEVLNLLWSVLTHPDVSLLKSYDSLKRYVTRELKVEPEGSGHRERFLQSCIAVLSKNAEITSGSLVDELQALRMVKLTRFILEACPRSQSNMIIQANNGALPMLLFTELVASLERRNEQRFRRPRVQHTRRPSLTQTPSSNATDVNGDQSGSALETRLRILRYAYGLSDTEANVLDPVLMSAGMLNTLWKLCAEENPEEQQAVMVFVASASRPGTATHYDPFFGATGVANATAQSGALLSEAFSEDVCYSVFLTLFCAPSFNYYSLGDDGYRSFQLLFTMLCSSECPPDTKKLALDALWRVCLTAERDAVASQAMKDLLTVYVRLQSAGQSIENGESVEQMLDDEADESFGDRMFEFLERVKTDLEARVPSAERSVQRCMRILNTAIGRAESEGFTTASTLARLSSLCRSSTYSTNLSLADTVKCLPHGLRGQACCRRIGIIAKFPRPHNQNASSYDNASPRHETQNFSLEVHPLETLASVKYKVAQHCQCTLTALRPIQINGRARVSDHVHMGVNVVPEDTVMDELGVVQGCEVVFVIAERSPQNNANGPVMAAHRSSFTNDLSAVFYSDDGVFANRLFTIVLSILGSLQWQEPDEMSDGLNSSQATDIHKLVWDLLLAMPTNERIADLVKSSHGRINSLPSVAQTDDSMEVEATGETLFQLLDSRSFDRSVYVLLTIDAFLQPSPEALSIFPHHVRLELEKAMVDDANSFRRTFIDAGGFGEVVRFFSVSGGDEASKLIKARRGNAVALRILKSCLFGNIRETSKYADAPTIQPDEAGLLLLRSLSDTGGLLKSLTAMVVEDRGISSSTVADVLRFLRLLFQAPNAADSFVLLPDAEKFLVIVLMWDEGCDTGKICSSISAAMHVRRNAHDLILQTPSIADCALPWLINAIDSVRVDSESTTEYFDVLEKLVSDNTSSSRTKDASEFELRGLASTVCKKLATCPRPGNGTDLNDISTGVLCGCLKLLRALILHAGGSTLRNGTNSLLAEVGVDRWSEIAKATNQGNLSLVSNLFSLRSNEDDIALIDLMGAIFDGFLTPRGSSSVAICCDKESRACGFNVISAAAMECKGSEGYISLTHRINNLVSVAVPKLRHGWGQFGGNDVQLRNRVSKYSGLRNQGCTCYMNSFLQQLFMIPSLRQSMCSSNLPSSLRSVGGNVAAKGIELVGKKISLQWDTGTSFDAIVEAYNTETDLHTIRYCPIQVIVGASTHRQVNPEEIARLPPSLPDEFILSEGRPGKETGVFEIVTEATAMEITETKEIESIIKESEDEAMSRHLLEEVQRTFIHLEQGSRGHCFDPRALVEACACLKLEFDVWQQNDASEFATKLLDRLEISLKKWAPENFRYMDHTFGLKQTKQKICKKCGLKTSREEKLLNIDCQIRGKSDIHEALTAMTEVEIMEGSNQVYCEKCKENTDTILKSAISTLPNILILSLKRFDLDYNTFETVKLNSRCAFGQTLNMKQYTLDALEVLEHAETDKIREGADSISMETEENDPNSSVRADDPLRSLPDENYEYRLVGVLVHAGVAQGGHYYSFIKDRITACEEKWYRFDDEDVTPFDPGLIETECFGGKVKKETKWPNGQVHTVEQEQFANALMVFYEKVMLNDVPSTSPEPDAESSEEKTGVAVNTKDYLSKIQSISGYDVFEPDVRRSNETHQWQAFLFDSEFQTFLKGMLHMCRQKGSDPLKGDSDLSWRTSVLETLITFMFDVLLYSSDCSNVNEWARILDEILTAETTIAISFVQKLAKKTGEISSNWLRTYVMDCPDHSVRAASLRVFMAAIRSAARSDEERKHLPPWVRGWRDLLVELTSPLASNASSSLPPYPCELNGKFSGLEDRDKVGGGVSSLGIIISFVNTMLEAVTRYWRFSSELCHFVRFLSSISLDNGDMVLRRPMIDAQVPARIIALITRDRTPTHLRNAFPGASVAVDAANTQMRPETSPSAHILPMNGNQAMNSSDLNGPRSAGTLDYIALLEALTSLAGIPGTQQAQLVVRETEDIVRGRQRFTLTEESNHALTKIFHESCAPGASGMEQREISLYLHRSGVDSNEASTQKILEMLSKYPTTPGRGNLLSVEGFLAYYRDCIQSNDTRLRVDLHAFGFRPNLSRRSDKARFFKVGERDTPCPPVQSVCLDVAEAFEGRTLELGQLANYALANCPYLYNVAYEVCEPLMQYLLASATMSLNVGALIERTLESLYVASNEWEVTAAGCSSMLQVFASTPGGEDQAARVHKILTCTSKPVKRVDYGSGVLTVLRALHQMRQTQHWSEVQWTYNRYMHIVKDLYSLYPIYSWVHDNRNTLGFLERELLDSRQISTQNPVRADYVPREQETQISLDHNTNSDSDVGGMHDSDDDDEDSQFDNLEMTNIADGPAYITVQGAGNPVVNGLYKQEGFVEGSMCYVMDGMWENKPCKTFIFTCKVSNDTKHWFISIIPFGFIPGTTSDVDFYTAPITNTSVAVPPKSGWSPTNLGADPPPRLIFHDNDNVPERIGNGTIIENDIDEDQNGNPYE